MDMKSTLFSALALAAVLTGPMYADPINGATAGLASPASVITFTEVPTLASNDMVTNQFQPLGVTFSPFVYFDPAQGFPFGQPAVATFDSLGDPPVGSVELDFTSILSAAAFQMVGDPNIATVTALMNGTAVDSFSAPLLSDPTDSLGNPNPVWYGFQNIQFNAIQIALDPSAGDQYMLMTNLEMNPAGSVPEPATAQLSLAAMGMLGFALFRRRLFGHAEQSK